MTWMSSIGAALVCTLCVCAGGIASADEPTEKIGEVHISLKGGVSYCKVALNGASYTATEFNGSGTKLYVKGLPVEEAPHVLTLTPFDDSIAPVDITVAAKDFKRRLKKRVYHYIATQTATFTKGAAKPDTAKPGEEGEADPPAEPTTPPPGDDDDDL